jgi:hypothetical protein
MARPNEIGAGSIRRGEQLGDGLEPAPNFSVRIALEQVGHGQVIHGGGKPAFGPVTPSLAAAAGQRFPRRSALLGQALLGQAGGKVAVIIDLHGQTPRCGNPTTTKKSLRHLKPGDFLAFYCGLQE